MLHRLCIGTAQFGLNYGIANNSGKLAPEEISQIIKQAKENQLVYFDTAQAYGDSETQLGRAFAEHQYFPKVISKISPEFIFQGKASLRDNIKGSLSRLNIPSLHGLLLHRLHPTIDSEEFLAAIGDAKAEGLIENFGVSVYTPEEAQRFVTHPAVDMLQVPCNIFDRRLVDQHFFTTAAELNKHVFIRSVYLQGLLLLASEDLAAKGQQRAMPFLDLLQRFLRYYGVTGKTFAAHALLTQFPQTTLVIGVDTLAQFLDNLAIFRAAPIAPSTIAAWWGSVPQIPEEVLDCRLWGR
jgi:aryl-alcohol dehydrogenase-like predicted oxidoreductase